MTDLPDRFRYSQPIEKGQPDWTYWHTPGKKTEADEYIFTASVVPCILGRGYDTVQKTYRKYMGTEIQKEPSLFELRMLQYGNDCEPAAIRDFYEDMKGEGLHDVYGVKIGTIVHPEHSNFGAIPDQLMVFDHKVTPLEVKCPYNGKVPSNVLDIQDKYLIQLTFQMACLPAKQGVLTVWSADVRVHFWVPYEEKLFQFIEKKIKWFENQLSIKEQPKPQREDTELTMILTNLKRNCVILNS
jgi:hypothetical protein